MLVHTSIYGVYIFNLPFSKWEKYVTRQPRADTGSYFCVCDIAQKGDYMQLRFNDGTTLAIQKAIELGGGLQVLVAGTTPEELLNRP